MMKAIELKYGLNSREMDLLDKIMEDENVRALQVDLPEFSQCKSSRP